MTFVPDQAVRESKDKMEKGVAHLEEELRGIRTGRATPGLVEHIRVDAYGSQQPLKNLAQISTPDARTVVIKPFDNSLTGAIERAIQASDIGVNPGNDGKLIRLNLPPLTEERRQKLVHHVKEICEQQRVQLRNLRRDILKKGETAKKEHAITEDQFKGFDKQINDLMKAEEKRIDDILKKKSEEITSI